MGKTPILIESNASETLHLIGGIGTSLNASADSPTFDLLAYSGGLVRLDGQPFPVVFDLATTRIADSVPLLYRHNHEIIVGHTEQVKITLPNQVTAIGKVSGSGAKAVEIKANAKNNYPWQLSVGLISQNLYKVEQGQSVRINAQLFNGPILVASDNELREISFVSVGADSKTYARLIASLKDSKMNFASWLASLGIDSANWTAAERASAEAAFNAWQKVVTTENATQEEISAAALTAVQSVRSVAASAIARVRTAPTPIAANAGGLIGSNTPDPVEELRVRTAAEFDRQSSIRVIAEEFGNPVVNGVSLTATAVRENWDVTRTRSEMELARLRAARPTNVTAGGRNGGSNGSVTNAQLLEAAVAQATNMPNIATHYPAQVLDAAHTRFKGRIGLQELLIEAAIANGYSGGYRYSDSTAPAILKAAFSTIDIPGLLSNTINKYLVAGFMSVDQSWRQLAQVRSVSDFKAVPGYRGVGSFRFDVVAPDGQIKHGSIQETAYTNQAKTYGKMFGIPRQVLINDDLGFLESIPRQLGRGGALSLVYLFWTTFMNNSSFFVAGNNNVTTGALSIAGLNTAKAKFRKQTDEAGEYVMVEPKYLVVPTELEDTANQLYTDTYRGGGNTGDYNENPYKGKYPPITSPYLSDSRFTGNSTTAYYLLADPNDVPVIDVVFLDGVQTPTVDTAEADFAQLGIQMRGYFDFGVALMEPRGGVRSTGV